MTEAQILYIEEVLGASVSDYLAAAARTVLATSAETGADLADAPPLRDFEAHEPPPVLVLCAPLTEETRGLLNRILASVRLPASCRFEILERLDAPTDGHRHVICFRSGEGRRATERQIWWDLPELSRMLGPTADVAVVKRAAWATLQQFQKEYV